MWQNKTENFSYRKDSSLALFITRPGMQLFDKICKRYKVFFLRQIHSNEVVNLDEKVADTGDGMITSHKNIFLGVKVADCLPIYFVSPTRIGIAHAGWRGTLNRIVLKMVDEFPDRPSYFFGPCINSCCYEVGSDLYRKFKDDFPQNVITFKDKKMFLDLKEANRYLLKDFDELGSLDLCTCCNPGLFYSFRRDKEIVGRNFALIGLIDEQDFRC